MTETAQDAPVPRVLLFKGVELGARLIWTWEWADGRTEPRFAMISGAARAPLLDELDEALPEPLDHELAADSDALRAALLSGDDLIIGPGHAVLRDRDSLRELTIARRVAGGALADPVAEDELLRRLAAELLPTELVDDIEESARSGPVRLAILPTPDCAHVPWGLLVVREDGRRLLELCDVAVLAAGLPDEEPDGVAAPVEGRLPLYVIDPDLTAGDVGGVLTPDGRYVWKDRVAEQAAALQVDPAEIGDVGRSTMSRNWLSEALHRRDRSHLVYLGHVTTRGHSGRGASLELNDARSVFSTERIGPGQTRRSLRAVDVLAGTQGASAHLDSLRAEHPRALVDEFGRLGPRFPGVDPDGTRELPGDRVWPMPPHVAIIACRSGLDGSHGEPFGLVTAMLMVGARAVIATRWRLLTDVVEQYLRGEDPDLAALSLEVEEQVLGAPDIVGAFSEWQRGRLRLWRANPVMATAPLGFGAFALHVPEWSVRQPAGAGPRASTQRRNAR